VPAEPTENFAHIGRSELRNGGRYIRPDGVVLADIWLNGLEVRFRKLAEADAS